MQGSSQSTSRSEECWNWREKYHKVSIDNPSTCAGAGPTVGARAVAGALDDSSSWSWSTLTGQAALGMLDRGSIADLIEYAYPGSCCQWIFAAFLRRANSSG